MATITVTTNTPTAKINVEKLISTVRFIPYPYVIAGEGGGGTTNHGLLIGLLDDDHPQYHNDARGDARYSQIGHVHSIGSITGLDAALNDKVDDSQVLTNVPAGAIFTDTVYDDTELRNTVSGKLDDVTAGTNVTIDKTDPNNPIISASNSPSSTGQYRFSTATTGDPGAKKLLLNNATPLSATSISISKTTDNNNDATAYLEAIKSGTLLYIASTNNSTNNFTAKATDVGIDNGTYFTIPITMEDANGTLAANAEIGLTISYTGGAAAIAVLSGGSVLFPSLKIGDADNNVELTANGLKFNGTATVFDDMRYDALNLNQTGPGLTLNLTEAVAVFASNANQLDYMVVSMQMSHGRKNGATIYPHIHFEQNQNAIPNFALQYRWQKVMGEKVTAWTPLACNVQTQPYSGTTKMNISKTSAGITPPAGDDVSDILQVRIIRDTTNALGLGFLADPFSGSVNVNSFDCHIEFDAFGSDEEYTK